MVITHQSRGRRAALAGLCVTFALAGATSATAYPSTPDGEPLHLEAAGTQTVATVDPAHPNAAAPGTGPSTPSNAVPLVDLSSNGTDWVATAMTAIAALALLALGAAAFALTGERRRSAGDPMTRERS